VSLGPTEYDFGDVRRGERVQRTFTIRNAGNTALELTAVRLSMPGMTANLPARIDSGADGDIVLHWTTDRVQGALRAVATVDTNDPRAPSVTLALAGIVHPPFDIEPGPAIFLSTFAGDDVWRELTLRSHHSRPVALRLEPDAGAHYVADLVAVEPGKSWRLMVASAPETAPGQYEEMLTLESDDLAVGRGRLAVHMVVNPELSANRDTIDFGEIALSSLRQRRSALRALDQFVTLTKREGAFRLREVRTDVAALAVRATPTAGESTSFRIDAGLHPNRLEAGPIDGTIWIETDDPEVPQLAIRVRGRLVDR